VVHRAKNARLEITGPVPWIDDFFSKRVERHRVDREVAPARSVLERQPRVALHDEALVAASGL